MTLYAGDGLNWMEVEGGALLKVWGYCGVAFCIDADMYADKEPKSESTNGRLFIKYTILVINFYSCQRFESILTLLQGFNNNLKNGYRC